MANKTKGDKQPTRSRHEYQPSTMICPPERHIGASFSEIYTAVKKEMNVGQQDRFEEVCQLVDALYSVKFVTLRQSLKSNFLPFSVGAKKKKLLTRKNRGLPSTEDLDHKEDTLISDFLQLMAAARYQLLTKKEWDTATAEKFQFYLPVDVNWDYFDAKLLGSFWRSQSDRRHVRKYLPHLSDRVLVLHRGLGLAEDKGMFINQKVDLLVEYLLVEPLQRLWSWFMALLAPLVIMFSSMFKRKPKGPPPLLTSSASQRYTADGTAMFHTTSEPFSPDRASGGNFPMSPDRASNPLSPGNAIADSPFVASGRISSPGIPQGLMPVLSDDIPESTHRAAVVVERRTLARLLPTTWAVIKNFHKTLHLQEPMYKEVVIMYRTSDTGRVSGSKAARVPARCRSNEDRLKDILAKRNIHVKCFHDIPLADIEVIFPDKKVYLKTISIITMLIQACTAFFAAMASLWKMGADFDFKVLSSALSLVAARCGQVYSSMQAERSKMIQDMVNILYDKTNDAQEGVLSMLLEDMSDQLVKEAVLAYTMLFLNIDQQVSQEDLDDMCEKFLDTQFGLKLDFAVEDALPLLMQWGMVQYFPRTHRYQALPLEVVQARLFGEWQKAYEAMSKPAKQKRLPLTALLPGGDRTPLASESTTATPLTSPGRSDYTIGPAGNATATSLNSNAGSLKLGDMSGIASMRESTSSLPAYPTSRGGPGSVPDTPRSSMTMDGDIRKKDKSMFGRLFKRKTVSNAGYST